MAAESTQAAPRPTLDVAIDRIWRFFCSVRVAIVEISILALLVLIGTLRGSVVPENLAERIPATEGFVDAWYDFDVFNSAIFGSVLAFISVAIAICTINRVPGIWQTISHPMIRTTHGYLERAELSGTFNRSATVGETTEAVTELLKQKRYRVITEEHEGNIHLYADKNRFSKMATFPFHLALILLLVGGIVASYYGFREQEFILPEGESREVGHGTGYSIYLNRFTDSYTAPGVAEEFASDIDVYRDGDRVGGGEVTVNNPVSVGNATIYQAGFGQTAQVRVTDATGEVVFNGEIDLGIFTAMGNPDAPGGFAEMTNTDQILTLVGPDTEPMNQPELDTLGLESYQMWVQIQPKTGMVRGAPVPQAVVNLNEPAQVGEYKVEFLRNSRFTVLQIAYNPGIPIFIIASLLLISGLLVTFYLPLRRIRGMIASSPEGSMLRLVPLARRDWGGKRSFLDLLGDAEEAMGSSATIKKPDRLTEWAATPGTSITTG